MESASSVESGNPIGLLIGFALIALIPMRIAGKKGYNKVVFYFFGLFLFLPALIVALVIKPKNLQPTISFEPNSTSLPPDEQPAVSKKKIKCAYCGRYIESGMDRCPGCGAPPPN